MRYPLCLQLLPVALALSTAAHAQTTFDTYRLTRMEEVVGPNIGIGDINAQGEMVGAQRLDSGRIRAVLFRDGMVIDLGDLMGGASPDASALAINDRTQIIGSSVIQDASGNLVTRGFLWQDGQISDLGISGTFADINNRGQIVGNSRGPFLWDNGRTTFLELLMNCPPSTNGAAVAINENGVVVGRMDSAPSCGGTAKSWFWSPLNRCHWAEPWT